VRVAGLDTLRQTSEVSMGERATCVTPVVIFGHVTDLSTSIASALQHRGFLTRHLPPPADAPPGAFPLRVDETDDVGSALFVLDSDLVRFLFDEGRAFTSRRRLSACEAATCDAAVAIALTNGARRFLVAVDGRRLSFGHRTRALRWTRELLHRITYECALNGVTDPETAYAIIDTDHCIQRTADGVVAWHTGARPPSSRKCVAVA
jgi:hypothetical protein